VTTATENKTNSRFLSNQRSFLMLLHIGSNPTVKKIFFLGGGVN